MSSWITFLEYSDCQLNCLLGLIKYLNVNLSAPYPLLLSLAQLLVLLQHPQDGVSLVLQQEGEVQVLLAILPELLHPSVRFKTPPIRQVKGESGSNYTAV